MSDTITKKEASALSTEYENTIISFENMSDPEKTGFLAFLAGDEKTMVMMKEALWIKEWGEETDVTTKKTESKLTRLFKNKPKTPEIQVALDWIE